MCVHMCACVCERERDGSGAEREASMKGQSQLLKLFWAHNVRWALQFDAVVVLALVVLVIAATSQWDKTDIETVKY